MNSFKSKKGKSSPKGLQPSKKGKSSPKGLQPSKKGAKSNIF
jgi:hypothetical protein